MNGQAYTDPAGNSYMVYNGKDNALTNEGYPWVWMQPADGSPGQYMNPLYTLTPDQRSQMYGEMAPDMENTLSGGDQMTPAQTAQQSSNQFPGVDQTGNQRLATDPSYSSNSQPVYISNNTPGGSSGYVDPSAVSGSTSTYELPSPSGGGSGYGYSPNTPSGPVGGYDTSYASGWSPGQADSTYSGPGGYSQPGSYEIATPGYGLAANSPSNEYANVGSRGENPYQVAWGGDGGYTGGQSPVPYGTGGGGWTETGDWGTG